MSEQSLGRAVLELDADATPLNAALGAFHSSTLSSVQRTGAQVKSIFAQDWKVAAATIGVGALAAGVAITAVAYKIGDEFDKAYDKIRTGTGATGQALDGLKNDFKAALSQVPDSADEVATAIADINTRLGLTGQPLQEVSVKMLELSRITGTDLGSNIRNLTRLFGDWSVSADDMSPSMDKLYRVSQNTGISMDDLSGLMVQFGSPLRQLGFDFDTAAAMFGRFEKEGVNTQALMPGLKFALKNLSQPTDDLKNKMKDLGVSLDQGPAKSLKGVMKAIKDAPNDLAANAIAFDVFGQRAGPDMAAAIREGRFELGDYLDVMKNGKSTIEDTAKQNDDLGEAFNRFKNNALVKIEPVATFVFNTINHGLMTMLQHANVTLPIVAGLLSVLGLAFLVWAARATLASGRVVAVWVAQQLKAVASAAVQMAQLALVAARWVASTIIIVAQAAIQVGAWLATQVAAIAAAVAASAAWIAATGGIILAIGLIVAAIYWVITHWDQVKAYIVQYWPYILAVIGGPIGAIVALVITHFQQIKDFIVSIWDALSSYFGAVLGVIKSIFTTYFNAYKSVVTTAWNAVKSATTSAWNAVRDAVRNRIDDVVGFARALVGRIRSALSGFKDAVVNIARAAWDGFKDAVGNRVDAVVSVAGKIASRIKSAVGNLGSLLYDAGRAVIQGLLDGLNSLLSSVYNTVSKIAGKIKSLKGPLPKDRVLLRPEGAAIITGLREGIESELGSLNALVSSVAPTIQQQFTPEPAQVNASPALVRLSDSIDRLNASGTIDVVDALVGTVNERSGYGLSAGRRFRSAGDGRLTA